MNLAITPVVPPRVSVDRCFTAAKILTTAAMTMMFLGMLQLPTVAQRSTTERLAIVESTQTDIRKETDNLRRDLEQQRAQLNECLRHNAMIDGWCAAGGALLLVLQVLHPIVTRKRGGG